MTLSKLWVLLSPDQQIAPIHPSPEGFYRNVLDGPFIPGNGHGYAARATKSWKAVKPFAGIWNVQIMCAVTITAPVAAGEW